MNRSQFSSRIVISRASFGRAELRAATCNNAAYRRGSAAVKGFTLSELLVILLIVSILAAVAVPLMRAKIDASKWSEANATAGAIRTSISTYIARHNIAETQVKFVGRSLDDSTTQMALGFIASDLTGTYFVPADYEITRIGSLGHAAITVTTSKDNAPVGSKTLDTDGSWQ